MIIMCCGMSRSGSTVQYQLVRDMVEIAGLGRGRGFSMREKIDDTLVEEPNIINVFKSEQCYDWHKAYCKQRKIVPIGIYRDPRDVAVSLDRFYSQRAKEEDKYYGGLQWTIDRHLRKAIEWQSGWESVGATAFKYEDYWPNLVNMANVIALALDIGYGIDIPNHVIKQAMENNVLSVNKSKIDSQENWIDFGTMLTKAHVGPRDGEPGQWRDFLPKGYVGLIERRYKNWMEDHAYEISGK